MKPSSPQSWGCSAELKWPRSQRRPTVPAVAPGELGRAGVCSPAKRGVALLEAGAVYLLGVLFCGVFPLLTDSYVQMFKFTFLDGSLAECSLSHKPQTV